MSDVVKGVLIGVLVAYLPLLVRAVWRRVRAWLARRAERARWYTDALLVYQVRAANEGVDPQEAARRWRRMSPLERTRWAARHADRFDDIGEDDFALLPEDRVRQFIAHTYANADLDDEAGVDRHAVQVALEQQLDEALRGRRDRRFELFADACEEVADERGVEPGRYGSAPLDGEPDEVEEHPAWRQAFLELREATSRADIRAVAERQMDRLQERWEAERRAAGQGADRVPAAAPTRAPARAVAVELPSDRELDGDPPDEPGIEQTSPENRAAIAGLPDEVVVIDGRPRYHRSGCEYLRGHESEPLPVGEALELGFTPCVHCGPNGVLLRQSAERP